MSGEMDKPLISRRLVDSDGSLAEAPSGAPKVGILGSGDFARSLATRLVGSGISVVVGSRNPKRTAGLFPASARVTFQEEAVSSPEIIFVAVFREHYSSLCSLSEQLAGKILVDVSNPTEQEHLRHQESNAEFLASLFPTCTVVKAFNVISAWTLQAGPRDGNRQGHSDSAQTRNVPHNIWSREAGLLERLVTNLVPAYQKGDLFFVEIFLRNYRRWGTMEQVMDIIFKKYRYLHCYWEEDEKTKIALCSIITMWMDCCPGDFYKCQNQDTLHELMYYVWLYMPSSDLLLRLEIILSDLENSVKKKNNKRRKESLYRRFRASLRCHRAASPELPISIPAVISTMVTREELEQSLDSGQHVKPEESVNCVEKPEQALCPVYSECILNSTNVTQAPAGPLQEEKDDGDSPLTFTVRLDQPRVSEVSTPGVQDKASPEGLMEYASSLSSREPLKDAQKVVSVEESEFVLTNKQICPDKSVQLQEIKSPPEELEPAPAPPQEGNPIFTEEVDPLEDSDSEYLPEGNLEAGLDLDIPSPIPEKILLFLFVMAVVKCAIYCSNFIKMSLFRLCCTINQVLWFFSPPPYVMLSTSGS